MTLSDILSRLEGVQGGNGQYSAKCPAHDDRRNSLSVSAGEDGKILLHCHAGCSAGDVAAAIGLTMKDLFTEDRPREKAREKPRVVATYQYRDADGQLIGEKLRYSDKRFTWRRPAASGWEYKKPSGAMLYNLPRVLQNDVVFLPEGEKDVDTLTSLNLTATCSPDGAGPGKWREHFTGWLQGKMVFIIQDNDEVGRAFAQEEAAAISEVAKSVKVLDLCEIWPELPEHGDVSDLIQHIGKDEGFVALMKLANDAPEWKPAETRTAPALVRASDVPYEPPRWLIAPYFQRGKGTLIQGDNGSGKTAFMCAVTAHVTTGRPILDIPVQTPGNVLLLSVEDDLPVLRGRIEASGGDLTKCYFMSNAAGLSFNSPEVETAVEETDARLVIFDPFQAFLGAKVDMFRSNETRPELAKLFEMCERHDCACVIIAHMVKSAGDKSPVNRSLGSVDIPAAMRSIMQLIRSPDDANECVMVHVKCSNAPKGQSIAYTIGDRGGVEWRGFSPMTPDDLTAVVRRKEKGVPYENEPLVQVFNQLIADKPGGGFWAYEDVKIVGMRILGFPPFVSTADLKARLNGPLARELQEKDGLIVTCGHKQHGIRGIRIEQYQHPQSYQTKIDGDV